MARTFLIRESRCYSLSKTAPDRDRIQAAKVLRAVADALEAGQGWLFGDGESTDGGAGYAYAFPLTLRIQRKVDMRSLKLVCEVSGPGQVLKDRDGALPLIELEIKGEL